MGIFCGGSRTGLGSAGAFRKKRAEAGEDKFRVAGVSATKTSKEGDKDSESDSVQATSEGERKVPSSSSESPTLRYVLGHMHSLGQPCG